MNHFYIPNHKAYFDIFFQFQSNTCISVKSNFRLGKFTLGSAPNTVDCLLANLLNYMSLAFLMQNVKNIFQFLCNLKNVKKYIMRFFFVQYILGVNLVILSNNLARFI